MQKLIVMLALMLLSGFGIAQNAKTVTVTGIVSGDTKGKDYILYYGKGGKSDSVPIVNGKFVIKLPISETVIISMVTQYDKLVKQSYRPYYMLIDGNNDIQIEMDIQKGFFESTIKGSLTAEAYNGFQKERIGVYVKISQILTKIYGKSYVPQNDPLFPQLDAARDSLTKIYMGAYINEFVEKYKGAYVGVFVLHSEGIPNMKLDQLEKTAQLLTADMQEVSEAKKIAAYIRGKKNINIGTTVKNFVLNNPEGKPVSFSQFKGKYVWIDFWASWCVPCKKAFPHMQELYAKYKGKGFEILGISTDSKIEPWLNVLPSLQNPWTQVWDNKNIMSEFAVTAFPTSFLIDPDGKIILREVGYESNIESEMDKKLHELFELTKVVEKK